ncbi:MAG: hypothetical protein NVSMB6_04740 [Burkholderiaceae bacterium]
MIAGASVRGALGTGSYDPLGLGSEWVSCKARAHASNGDGYSLFENTAAQIF